MDLNEENKEEILHSERRQAYFTWLHICSFFFSELGLVNLIFESVFIGHFQMEVGGILEVHELIEV